MQIESKKSMKIKSKNETQTVVIEMGYYWGEQNKLIVEFEIN
jgi:hypothetical protein